MVNYEAASAPNWALLEVFGDGNDVKKNYTLKHLSGKTRVFGKLSHARKVSFRRKPELSKSARISVIRHSRVRNKASERM